MSNDRGVLNTQILSGLAPGERLQHIDDALLPGLEPEERVSVILTELLGFKDVEGGIPKPKSNNSLRVGFWVGTVEHHPVILHPPFSFASVVSGMQERADSYQRHAERVRDQIDRAVTTLRLGKRPRGA